jgi:DNA-binding transcriptional regulator YdaS (Cro superfamily)
MKSIFRTRQTRQNIKKEKSMLIKPLYSSHEVRQMLQHEVNAAGGQTSWARNYRVDRPQLSKMLHGRCPISANVARRLGLICIVYYVHESQKHAAVNLNVGRGCILSPDDVVHMLVRAVRSAGGQAQWARKMAVDRTIVNKVLNGDRTLPPQIYRALELHKLVAYARPDPY